MHSYIAFIFANVYDELFIYDEKYDELKFKDDVNAFIITESIKQKSKGLRDIWYRCYPTLMKSYKLYSVYDCNNLLRMIEVDDDYPYIPDAFVTDSMTKEHLFQKPIEQDYRFDQLQNDNDRKHYRFTKLARYLEKGLNIENYLSRRLIDIKQAEFALDELPVEYSIEYVNSGGDVNRIAKRIFTVDSDDAIFEKFNETAKRKYATYVIKYYDQLTTIKLLPYYDMLSGQYKSFKLSDPSVCKAVTDAIASEYETKIKRDDIDRDALIGMLKKTFDTCIVNGFSDTYLNLLLAYGTESHLVNACFIGSPEVCTTILTLKNQCIVPYICECIKLKRIGHGNINEMVQKYALDKEQYRFDIGFAWVEAYKEEPPLMFYPDPNYREHRSEDQKNVKRPWQTGRTITDTWAQYVNTSTTPMEMKSMKYYDYMIKSNGIKRNPDQTIMYSYFSNSNENKLIFCKSDVELLDPAIPRYYIPIDFRRLKQYLHEDLLTTDICMFAQLTKNDWEKIAGGHDEIDIVAFNDMKNVYRERTPLKDVIKYLIDNIDIEFDTTCQKAGMIYKHQLYYCFYGYYPILRYYWLCRY